LYKPASLRFANKAQLNLKVSFFVSILVLASVFLFDSLSDTPAQKRKMKIASKFNQGLQNLHTVVINKSVPKATQKKG